MQGSPSPGSVTTPDGSAVDERSVAPGDFDIQRIDGLPAEQVTPTDPALLERLPDIFPQASGRDIKGLAKLVSKYCSQKQVPPTEDVFRKCSMFRALEQVELPA